MAKKKQGPSFDFGEPSEALKAVLKLPEYEREYLSQVPFLLVENSHLSSASGILLAEEMRRLALVARHYGIEDIDSSNTGIALALLIARDHIPKFGPLSPQRGAPANAASSNLDLAGAVYDLRMKKRGRSIAEACVELNKKGRWKGEGAEKLEAAYHRCVKAIETNRKRIEQFQQAIANRPRLSTLSVRESVAENEGD